MTREELRTSPFFWSRLGFCYDPPRTGADGKPIVFSRDYAYYRRTHDAFRDAGVKHHTTILHSGWVGDGTYDYSLTDEVLGALLEGNPDLLYLPRVKLNAPMGWCKTHPRDVCVYACGPTDEAGIRALVDTPEQDILGFDAPGYAVNGGNGVYRDDRPNFGGRVALQSFSSAAWKRDAAEALRRLLRHLKSGPYAGQILGCHVAFGMCGETALWGAWGERQTLRRGDYGIGHREEFLRFAAEKYGGLDEACRAWGIPSPEAFEPPAPRELEGKKSSLRELFFDRKRNLLCADWEEFNSACDAEAVAYFCRVVKEELGPDAVAGAFYGYSYLPYAANVGHLAPDRLLNDPNVDFLASPKGYYRCLAGDPGGEQGASQSYNRRLVWLDEIDNWTHLDRRPGAAATPLESETILTRECVKNLTCAQGFWWMDLGEGWFDTPELMALISRMSALETRVSRRKHESVSQILIVTDTEAPKAMSLSYGLSCGLLHELQSECRLVGAPADSYRLKDLEELDLSGYRLIVFTNCFRFDGGVWERVRARIPAEASLVFNYVPGILKPDFDLAHVREVTGFSVEEFSIPTEGASFGYLDLERDYYCAADRRLEVDFPLVRIREEAGAEVLARYPDGSVMTAKRPNGAGGFTLLSAFPSLRTHALRTLAAEAGCRLLGPENCTVYADSRLIGFFPKDAFEGEVTLPAGRRVSGRARLTLSIPRHGSAVFAFDGED